MQRLPSGPDCLRMHLLWCGMMPTQPKLVQHRCHCALSWIWSVWGIQMMEVNGLEYTGNCFHQGTGNCFHQGFFLPCSIIWIQDNGCQSAWLRYVKELAKLAYFHDLGYTRENVSCVDQTIWIGSGWTYRWNVTGEKNNSIKWIYQQMNFCEAQGVLWENFKAATRSHKVWHSHFHAVPRLSWLCNSNQCVNNSVHIYREFISPTHWSRCRQLSAYSLPSVCSSALGSEIWAESYRLASRTWQFRDFPAISLGGSAANGSVTRTTLKSTHPSVCDGILLALQTATVKPRLKGHIQEGN